ncbi:MAG: DUF3795 domain-containing protein [Anaerolineales bacterium]|nr:DUF3795 domain-containing protein [Anaerolineales bacterium]
MPMIAYCGLDCSKCPTLLATKTNDRTLQEKTAREWSLQFAQFTGRNDLRAEEMVCDGCTADDKARVFLGCRVCPMRRCARDHKFETCAECAEFENCGQLNGFFTQAQDAKERLTALRKNNRR